MTRTATLASPQDAERASRLEAVRRRDAAEDGRFVFGVTTTGVYCRPSCASRPARSENIRFFPDPEAARAAGFRPCLRCRPDDGAGGGPEAAIVRRACEIIAAAESPPSLERLAKTLKVSPSHVHRLFKRVLGLSPKAYADADRAHRLAVSLADASTVTAAAYDAGFGSASSFYAAAPRRLGMTPTAARQGGLGQRITYLTADVSLGRLLAAFTEKGVCAILLGEDDAGLVADLRRRFTKAALAPADDAFAAATLASVIRLVEDPAGGADLPLDLRGTAFQERVWRALLQTSPGARLSYSELADRIDAPGAARAVASACAANPAAVAVPCHRVVRADGGLSGYRWGSERKAELLRREAEGATGAVSPSPRRGPRQVG